MGDVDEDEDEEELVFFGECGLRCHAGGCGFVGRGGLRRGHCGEDGGHVLGLPVGGGWLRGPGGDLAARGADPVRSGGQGRRGAVVSAFRARLGWAPAMCEGVRVGVCGREHSAWAAFGGLKPVRTPVAIFGSLGVCIYVPASRHWLISYSPIHLT